MSQNSDLLQTIQEMQQQLELYRQRLNTLEKKYGTSHAPQQRRLPDYITQFFKHPVATLQHRVPSSFLIWGLPFVLFPLIYYISGIFFSSLLTALSLLAYGLCAFLVGMYRNSTVLRAVGYGSYGVAITWFACLYKCQQLLHPHYWYIMHGMLACIVGVLAATHLVMQKKYASLTSFERRCIFVAVTTLLGVTLFVWGATTLILLFDDIGEKPSFFMRPFVDTRAYNKLVRTPLTQFLLICYYTGVALMCCIADLLKKNRIFKGAGMLLLALAGYNAWLLATKLHCPKTGFGMLVTVIACALFMIHTYRYRLHRNRQEER